MKKIFKKQDKYNFLIIVIIIIIFIIIGDLNFKNLNNYKNNYNQIEIKNYSNNFIISNLSIKTNKNQDILTLNFTYEKRNTTLLLIQKNTFIIKDNLKFKLTEINNINNCNKYNNIFPKNKISLKFKLLLPNEFNKYKVEKYNRTINYTLLHLEFKHNYNDLNTSIEEINLNKYKDYFN